MLRKDVELHSMRNTWNGMIQRCNNPNNESYKNYGGRGIRVCDRWLTFGTFLLDMGTRPKGMSLDRINNDGNYEPSNCRWTDGRTQRLNQRPAPVQYSLQYKIAAIKLKYFGIECRK